jgi:carboxymethylenebutenolidase
MRKMIFIFIVLAVSTLLYGCTGDGWVEPMAPDMGNDDGYSNNADDVYILGSDVTYFENITGYFAKPAGQGEYPGVIMIHEWWGLNDNIKDMARKLAAEGYYVLAVDLHKGKVATTPDQARNLTGSLNQQEALGNLNAAYAFLESQGATNIGSLGWCFGGGQSMRLALANPEIDATVIYYGNLITDSQNLSVIRWPVLGIFGDKDTGIPVEKVNAFEKSLDELSIDNEIYIYPGVGHAFANPTGQNYAPNETKDAWDKTLAFLDRTLK